ncbi:MAG: hypothetical protein FVQ83_13395 [Chloroflexi bacterium]|nr:hypothetical protein [Chloroflexota bacterium]
MAKIFITSTYGSDDATRATLPFLSAQAFLEKGHEVGVALLGEATFLMKDVIVDQIDGVGWPPLSEVLPKVIDGGASFYI